MDNKEVIEVIINRLYRELFLAWKDENVFHFTIQIELNEQLTLQAEMNAIGDTFDRDLWEVQVVCDRHFPIFLFKAVVEEPVPSLRDLYYLFSTVNQEEIDLFIKKIKVKKVEVIPTKKQIPYRNEVLYGLLTKEEKTMKTM